MKSFKDIVRKSFAQKSMWKRMIWSVALAVVQDFFQNKNIEWFVRYSTIYIKNIDHETKIQSFKQKKEILEKINQKLSDMGYSRKITDIRF